MMTNLFQIKHYKINKFLLSVTGQSPYDGQAKRRMILLIIIFFTITQITPQMIALVEFSDDPDVIIESIAPNVFNIAFIAKLTNAFVNSDKMLKLLKLMEMDWESLADQPEINILQFYTETGRQFTTAYTVMGYTITVVFMTQPILPRLLEIIKRVDDPKPKKFMFPVDYYGLDFDTYYYYMFLHSFICVTTFSTIILAADTLFLMFVQHACGMFTVIGHQLERIDDAIPDNFDINVPSSEDPAYQQLSSLIKKHTEVIEFANLVEASYSWCIFSLVGLNMIVMSVTGFQTVLRLKDSPGDSLRYATFTVAQLFHLFFQSFFSQRLMDHSERIRDYMMQAKWYKTSLCAQKLLNLITMRTYVPNQLTAGKFLVMSLDTFATILKTSMSYFTIIKSMQ